jgi:putative tricarboxylic transport membrane protein
MRQAAYECFARRVVVLICVCASAASSAIAQTEWKPTRPVEFVVGSGPGGGNDRTARLLQRIWRETKWLDPVTVVNRPGGGGALAYTLVSQQAGDAHHIVVARKAVLTNHILGRSPLHYSSLTPLAIMANEPNAVAVRADSSLRNLTDLTDLLRADPQAITTSVGSTRGGPSHMAVVQLAKFAGADLRKLKVVTFNGSAESVTNLLGGHIQLMSSSVDALVPHHRSGAMRILGVATAQRTPALPNVPTFREQGFDSVIGNWTAIMGPKGLTAAQIAYWEDLLERSFNHPMWKSMLDADALEHDFRKAQASREVMTRDYETERKMLAELGMVK